MVGHNLTLFLLKVPLKTKIDKVPTSGTIRNSFEVIGKVIEIDKHDDTSLGICIIKVNFVQFDLQQWRDFISSYIDQIEKIEKMQYRYDSDEEA